MCISGISSLFLDGRITTQPAVEPSHNTSQTLLPDPSCNSIINTSITGAHVMGNMGSLTLIRIILLPTQGESVLNPREELHMIGLLVGDEHVDRPPPRLSVERVVNLCTREEQWFLVEDLVNNAQNNVKRVVSLLRFAKWLSFRKAG